MSLLFKQLCSYVQLSRSLYLSNPQKEDHLYKMSVVNTILDNAQTTNHFYLGKGYFKTYPKGFVRPRLNFEEESRVVQNLPFKTCCFQVDQGDYEEAFYIHEFSPGDYLFANIGSTHTTAQWTHHDKTYANYDGVIRDMNDVTRNLYTHKWGQENIPTEKIKLKTSRGNENAFIRKVIYISPKQILKNATGPFGGAVSYSHRWEVAGHWFRIKGIGKDREGNYCIPGRSWRVPHVKGPKDKPIILKQRVHGGSNNGDVTTGKVLDFSSTSECSAIPMP